MYTSGVYTYSFSLVGNNSSDWVGVIDDFLFGEVEKGT
nr:hypothetical protein [uncultured archaeon]